MLKEQMLLEQVRRIRLKMPRLGGRKLFMILAEKMNKAGLNMGRDAFFNLMRKHGLGVRRRRRYRHTTQSNHWLKKYDNLLKDYAAKTPNEVWVSDITYIDTREGFSYLYLITDAYSRKIVGWSLSRDLKAQAAVDALQMAVKQNKYRHTIHHSDRGIQYCCSDYISLLNKYNIQVSMSEPASPTQNAIAERVNGILKTEWIYTMDYKGHTEAFQAIKRIINLYNNERPHSSVSMLTPARAHTATENLNRTWKKYPRKPITLTTDLNQLIT